MHSSLSSLSFGTLSILSLSLAPLCGCSASAPEAPPSPLVAATSEAEESSSFGVDFAGCSEVASIGTVTTAAAREIVPPSFALAPGDANGPPFVVRIAHCAAVRIDGGHAEPGTVAQIGVTVVPPEGRGDIDNYTALFYTTSGKLAERLRRLGVPAQHVENLDYDYRPNAARTGGSIAIRVPRPGRPTFTFDGTVAEPTAAAVPFEAIWWQERPDGSRVRMDTPIPAIAFGGASMTLTTDPANALAGLVGSGTSSSFPFLDSFNRFAGAHMTVAVVR